jgi:hypothetical protein
MTDARTGAPAGAGTSGVLAFLAESLSSLRNGRLLLPAALLTVLLTASNIVLLKNPPVTGEPPVVFALAALLRVVGLFALAVAVLRVLTKSARPPFRPDGAFWLYGLTILFGIAVSVALRLLLGNGTDPGGALTGLAMIVIGAPLAAWFTALAVERPLAVNPALWLRSFTAWLPALLLWSLLIVLPLGQLHTAIGMFLLRGAGDYFWPLALFDGPLSALLSLLGLALAATAYRRVARG